MLEGARKFSFPAGLLDGDPDSVMLCIPVPLVPYFRRFFSQVESPYVWKTAADFERAYPIFAEIEAQMAGASCLQQLIDEQRRLYRLWDSALNGTQYTVDGDVITPAIPAVPPASVSAPNAMRAHVGRLWQLAENEVAGVTAGPGEGIEGAPALADDTTARALLRRLITGIDGNGSPAPSDNLLMALRGTAQAGAERNVIDALTPLATSDNVADLVAAVNRLRGSPPAGDDPDLRVDMQMLSAALTALRGSGPENTLRSINESIWNLAGPAPGRNLVELYDHLSYLLAYEQSGVRWTSAGLLHVIMLLLSNPDIADGAANLLERILSAINSQTAVLSTVSTNTANMASCCAGMAANPLADLPAGICAHPFSSTTTAVLPVNALIGSQLTVAAWNFATTTEFQSGDIIGLDATFTIRPTGQTFINWSGYRFYVASQAQMFGAAFLDPVRWPTNKWLTLPYVQSLLFSIDGDENDLKVYICRQDDPLGGACPGSIDPLNVTSWQTGGKSIPGATVWEMGERSGGTVWARDINISVDLHPTQPALNSIHPAQSGQLCISYDVSTEPGIARIGVRGFMDGGATYDEIADVVAPIDIYVYGNTNTITLPINTYDGAYEISDYALIPYIAFNGVHETAPELISFEIAFIPVA